jgi:hypothetical protein
VQWYHLTWICIVHIPFGQTLTDHSNHLVILGQFIHQCIIFSPQESVEVGIVTQTSHFETDANDRESQSLFFFGRP